VNVATLISVIAGALFIGMVVFHEIGYQIGRFFREKDPDRAHIGIGAVETAIFGLFGLILAFTFAGAASRLDNRRHMIVDEANAIGTAYLRIDLLAATDQPVMRDLFRHYVDARFRVYRDVTDQRETEHSAREAASLQSDIWSHALVVSTGDQSTSLLLLPAINEMIDITTSRTVALNTHTHPAILFLLISLALFSGLIAGYASAERGTRSALHMLVFTLSIAITIYAVLDLDYPRAGLIRIDSADRALIDLRETMK
jgi:hypothetical protein